MKKLVEKLTFRFSLFGALIVALQSLPNILWAVFPPGVNRLAGNASSSAFIEYGEHILGVLIVVMLLFLANKTQPNQLPRGGWAAAAYAAIAVYWCCWALYFAGVQPNWVIYAMVVFPPISFFSAGMAEKVWPIPVASGIFLLFHLLVALENFPIAK
jgi:hypothetical protein